jgi:hypothetical protein
MRRLPALVAALLIPAAQPFLVGTAVSTSTLLLAQSSAQAQTAEAVAKVAQSITVRIEGATQGSGVLVKREGNLYTVLTAWHVVNWQRPGEELDIYTPDGQMHRVKIEDIEKIKDVDMAILNFTGDSRYQVADIAKVTNPEIGSLVYVAGYPIKSSAVPVKTMRFLKGLVIGSPQQMMPQGYELMYDAMTLPGMSGGPVLDNSGFLLGIHGRAETNAQLTESTGIAVKTGTNQGIPIKFAQLHASISTTSQAEAYRSSTGQTTDSMFNNATRDEQKTSSDPKLDLIAVKRAIAAGNYLQADIATETILLKSANEEAPLTKDGIAKLPCNLLIALDDAWSTGSLGKYGFKTQSSLLNLGGYSEFEIRTTWRRAGFLSPIERNDSLYPNGYFPRKVVNGPVIKNLIDRFRKCPSGL